MLCWVLCSNAKLDLVTRVTGMSQATIIIPHAKKLPSDLVGRMKTADMISQLGNGAPGIDSLKIPAYQWWSEALHGVAGSPGVHFGGNV